MLGSDVVNFVNSSEEYLFLFPLVQNRPRNARVIIETKVGHRSVFTKTVKSSNVHLYLYEVNICDVCLIIDVTHL